MKLNKEQVLFLISAAENARSTNTKELKTKAQSLLILADIADEIVDKEAEDDQNTD